MRISNTQSEHRISWQRRSPQGFAGYALCV